jgi:hypothetical protein
MKMRRFKLVDLLRKLKDTGAPVDWRRGRWRRERNFRFDGESRDYEVLRILSKVEER